MVPMAGVEPARVSPPPPQGGASTNFTTSAFITLFIFTGIRASCPLCAFKRAQPNFLLGVNGSLPAIHPQHPMFYIHKQNRELKPAPTFEVIRRSDL